MGIRRDLVVEDKAEIIEESQNAKEEQITKHRRGLVTMTNATMPLIAEWRAAREKLKTLVDNQDPKNPIVAMMGLWSSW